MMLKLTIEEIADLVNGKLSRITESNANDAEIEIYRVSGLGSASANEITFIEKNALAENTNAACLIVPEDFSAKTSCPVISVKNPKLAFAKVAAVLHKRQKKTGVYLTASIAKTCEISDEVFVGANVSIGENSRVGRGTQIYEGARIGVNVLIGEDCFIYPNVVIYDRVSIGSKVILHAGAVIGADGFGFVRGEAEYVKFPQIGTVIIEDDVEIGAQTCIDRGSLGTTRIGRGTKIDNLVQIAHNVSIGERVIIAAQTGISGSTVIESDCVIGGQVGMGDHARVLSGTVIGSQAGVLPGKIVRTGVWWGTPVQPLDEYKRQNVHLKGISRLKEELKELKKQFSDLKNKTEN
jgi:UDP-3-O-[3-hydroxymyristoyl] glucosamine N-acyltransferase